VDLDDYGVFLDCENGPGNPPASQGCHHRATVDETTGRLAADSDSLGPLVVRYTYDGLGRLIGAERPDNPADPTASVLRFDYYYDGVRRLQEDLTVSYADGYPPDVWTERQYVYGPDYVDEFVAQIDAGDTEHPTGHVFYMLQDANYNVVALVGLVGGTWQVVEQYTYEPYGAVAAVDPSPCPINRVGHQGLFYEHLDADWGLQPGSIGLYHNRNRWYSPALGRFTSRDPNETGMPIIEAMARNGEALTILASGLSAAGQFRGGMNLYGYLGSNPLNGLDPLGLYDYFEEVDAVIAGLQAERVVGIERVSRFAYGVSQMAQRMALETLIVGIGGPAGVAIVAGWGMYDSIDDMIESRELNWSNGVGLAVSAFAIGELLHQFASARNATRGAYLAGRALTPHSFKSLLGKGPSKVRGMRPSGWAERPAVRGHGWVWVDENGIERLRYMYPDKNGRFVHEKTGYFRWTDGHGSPLDRYGNVVRDPAAHDATHIIPDVD
jgi:RHS repeat-associated protein